MASQHLRLLASSSFVALLAGMTPSFAQTSDNGPVALPTVSVGGTVQQNYKVDTPTILKLTEPLRDTPQSIDAIPKQLLDDQGVTTLRDALRNVAGVSLAAGEAGAQGDNLTLRGFSARNDIYLDGMRDFGSYYRDPFNYDGIQVLKGPSSILFGRGSTGGVIEQDSKQAGLTPFANASVSLDTASMRRATLDVNQPLGFMGSGAAFRINLMANDNMIAGRDTGDWSRIGIAPTLAFGLGTDTRINLSYLHQTEYDVPDYGLPWVYSAGAGSHGIATVANAKGSNYYGFTSGNYLRTNVDIATAKFEHDVNDYVTFSDRFRYAHYARQVRITEPQIDAGPAFGANAGATFLVPPGTPASSLSVTRNQIASRSLETFLTNQSDATIRFSTGDIQHTAVGGVEFVRETSNPTRYTTLLTNSNGSLTPLANPNPGQPYNATTYLGSRTQDTSWGEAIYGMDTIKLGEQWEFIAGARFDRFASEFNQVSYAPAGNISGVVAGHPVDMLPSYRAAIVYKPLENGSIYFDYGTSFNPSAEALALTVATASLAPEKTRTFELGTKWDLFHDQLQIRSAIYRTNKYNVREADPNNSTFNILAGDARVDGFEFEVVGHITEAWQVTSGYSYMYSVIDKSPVTGLGSDIGNRLANVPAHTFNLWTTYNLPWYNVQIGGGMNYVAARYAQSTPRLVCSPPATTCTATTPGATAFLGKLPGYAIFNVMAKYPVNEKLDVQVNINNLFDKFYYDTIHPSHVIPGAGRTAMFTANYKF
jgi:catecholate siderophore receptor